MAGRRWSRLSPRWGLGLISLAASACCVYGVWGVAFTRAEGYHDPSGANPPAFYQVGDTVTLVVEEDLYEANCREPAGPSDAEPDAYEWETSEPAVARILAPGRLYFAAVGAFRLTVSTRHGSDVLDGRVVPRVADVRLTPPSATIDVGDTVSFLIEALDAEGRVIRTIGRPSGSVRMEASPFDPTNPVAANQAENDGVHFVYRGYRPGSVVLTARLPIYGALHLADTATLVVR